jgi:hypothetical protein
LPDKKAWWRRFGRAQGLEKRRGKRKGEKEKCKKE